MEKSNQEKTKFAHSSWWIFGIIGAIIGLVQADGDGFGMWLFIGISNGIFWGWIIGRIYDSVSNSETVKTVGDQINKIKDKRETIKETKRSMSKYQDAKQRFQFLSKDTLLEKLDNFDDGDNMVKLALEEELVSRGILDYSPMHEKLNKINEVSENVSEEEFNDEVLRSKEFIASRLNCDVENAKLTYFAKLKQMEYNSEDLLESEKAFSEQAKEETIQLNMQVENTPSSIILNWTREFIASSNYKNRK